MQAYQKLQDYFSGRDRGRQLLLVAAVFLLYLPYWGSPFIFDDHNLFSNGAIDAYANRVFDGSLRWLSYASLGWTYAWFSAESTHLYHLGNVVLHAASVIVLFFLIKTLYRALYPQQDAVRQAWGACLAALIFAIHPVAVYAVGYVVQRSIVMATLFSLLMLFFYLRGLLTGQRHWLLWSVLAYLLACFSKEHSVLMPLVVMALHILLRQQNKLSVRTLLSAGAAYLGVGALITLRAKGVLGAPYEVMAAQLFEQQGVAGDVVQLHVLSALTQAGLYFKYLFLWLLPDVGIMSVDMREAFVPSTTAAQGWLGMAAFVAYGVYAARLLWRGGERAVLGFALLYPWLLFGVEMSGIRVQEPFVLYRSYLWLPGIVMVIPWLWMRFPQRKATYIAIASVMILSALAWNRLETLADPLRMWNEAAQLLKSEDVPGADRIYYNRGQAEMRVQQWEAAIEDFKRAARISPQLAPIHYELGSAYAAAGKNEEALQALRTANAIREDNANTHLAMGMVLKRLQRDQEAMQEMRRSCELKNSIACLITNGTSKPGK